jgi:periplasmic divalent cation tolerance protein
MSLVQVLTTFESREDAVALAHAAVEERVAACVQILDPITSVYRWEGAVLDEQEVLCLLKAPGESVDALVAFIRARHPYDTPEITVVESLFTDERYLAWANDQVS